MFRFEWSAWRRTSPSERERIAGRAIAFFETLEKGNDGGRPGGSALFSQLGHKGDLLMIHFRESIAGLNSVELALAQTELHDFLKIENSYLSVVELGLYESSVKTYAALAAEGHQPHTREWDAAMEELATRQAAAMAGRLYPAIPNTKYVCFYPMDRKRGGEANW